MSDKLKLDLAAKILATHIKAESVDVFLVAGSGFREALPDLENPVRIKMSAIPHFPSPAVAGHGDDLIFGTRNQKSVLIATGRVHLYEGYSANDVVFATRLAHQLGCRAVILTNAAGSVDLRYPPGSLIAISDQINLTGQNCEATTPGVPAKFTDMTNAYDRDWRKQVIAATGIPEGIYAGVVGPSYETPAEARMLALHGANVVGMSTVQESIAARTLGMKVFGLSLVTNMSGGLGVDANQGASGFGATSHAEVLDAGRKMAGKINSVLSAALAASHQVSEGNSFA